MITNISNPRAKHIRALQSRRRARYEARAFVIEGARLAQEVVAARAPVEYILHAETLQDDERRLVEAMAALGGRVSPASDKVLAACSTLETPPKIIASLPFPDVPIPESRSLTLVLDRIGDPGNLGTILRTALAAGVDLVVLTPGSADPFNPKVVRGAMGAQLRLPIVSASVEELPRLLEGASVFLAEARQGRPYYEIDWRGPAVLVIGSEPHGIHPDLQALGYAFTHIPMPGGFESLNAAVAAGVLLFEVVRQREAS